MEHFDLSDFNHNGELKMPAFLVLVLVYLSRYPVVLLMSGLSSFILNRRGIEFEGFDRLPIDGMLSSLPAMGILAVVLLRVRLQEKGWARKMLQFGKPIMLVIALVQCFVMGRTIWQTGHDISTWIVLEGVFLLYCLAYIVRSRKTTNYFRVYGRKPEVPPG